MQNISNLLGESYLKEFKVIHSQTLFEPVWENLRVGRCPLCGNKLKETRKGIALCSGVKHKKAFVIKLDSLKKLSPVLVK